MLAVRANRISAVVIVVLVGACTDPSLLAPLTNLVEGDLVITEIMAQPTQVAEANGEWFEVHNRTRSTVQLMGLVFRDDGSDNDTVTTSLLVPAGRYVVFGGDADRMTNGNYLVDYEYGTSGSFSLDNAADQIEILLNGVRIDRVDYGAGYPLVAGTALSLTPASTHLSNDSVQKWCGAVSTYGAGDRGTPNAANPVC